MLDIANLYGSEVTINMKEIRQINKSFLRNKKNKDGDINEIYML